MIKRRMIDRIKHIASDLTGDCYEYVPEALEEIANTLEKLKIEESDGGFTGLTKVMYIDPVCTTKDKKEKEPLKALKRILDSEGVCYSELKNKDTTEIKVENLPGVVKLLLEHFDIKGHVYDAEYFIFWEDK